MTASLHPHQIGRKRGVRRHGLRSTFRHYGCRCEECCEAERWYNTNYKRRKREFARARAAAAEAA